MGRFTSETSSLGYSFDLGFWGRWKGVAFRIALGTNYKNLPRSTHPDFSLDTGQPPEEGSTFPRAVPT